MDNTLNIASKSKGKKIVLSIVLVLIVSIVIVGIVFIYKSYDFRINKISKIELGMKECDVEEILGVPTEKSEFGDTFYWYSAKGSIKLKLAEILLEKVYASENVEKTARLLEKYDALIDQLELDTFKVITVTFDMDGYVSSVLYDKKSTRYGAVSLPDKEAKKRVLKVDVAKGTLVTIDGDSHFSIDSESSEIPYVAKYKDGSYYLGTVDVGDIEMYKEDGSYFLKWSDAFEIYTVQKLSRLKYEYVIEDEILTFYKTTEEEITIPSGVKEIDESAMHESESVLKITVPSYVEIIGSYAFAGAPNLEEIVLDNDIKEIKSSAFSSNDYLERVYFNGNKKEYSELNIKDGNRNLTNARVVYNCDPGTHTQGKTERENQVDVSCTQNGSYDIVSYCADCYGEMNRETKITSEATGHTASNVIKENVIEATCTENGSYDEVIYCKKCSEELSRVSKTIEAFITHVYENGYCKVCGEKQPYKIDGDYIYFGEYPQKIKSEEITITATIDERGYYLGSDGEWYAKVTATPRGSVIFSTGSKVTSGTVYYFKVEPIRWRILSESDGTALILCDSIIENHRYDDNSNNYADSEIRQWLNETFYEMAFDDLQKEIIVTTTVDNSVESTGYKSNSYACEDTEDKVFLPSYKEVTNSSYGFSSSYSTCDTARRMQTTDYSRATGASVNTSSSYYGSGYWWLRSPYHYFKNCARFVYSGGDVYNSTYDSTYVHNTSGIVPALQIQLD